MPYILLLRPHQWVKNVFVFAGLVFGRRMFDPESVSLTFAGFFALCLVSSAVYIINDIRDRHEDRLHPRKRLRPIASRAVPVSHAVVLAGLLLALGLGGSWALRPPGFGLIATAYFALQVGYTFAFKHLVILDVIAIGTGFVLRAVSGAVLIGVAISHWLVLCTFTLCLFMGFSKRRCELTAMAANGQSAGQHRRTLALYTADLLNHMTTLTAGVAIVTFLLYTVDKRTVEVFGTNYLLYTLPIVVYAVFRFALLVEHGGVDGPTDVVLKDRPFQIAILCWVLAALVIVYWGEQIRDYVESLGPPPAS